MSVIKSFFIAFSIYSKIPVPQFEWKDEDMRYTLCFFPWVGAVIGFLVWGWTWLSNHFAIGKIAYICMVLAISLAISGGFHVDGFMDTMDAFHSYQSREKKLEILKDSHIGAFAVIMLVLYYLIDAAAISEVTSGDAMRILCLGFFLSRTLSGLGVVFFKSAKKDGMLFYFASSAHEKIVKGVLILECLACCGLMLWISIWIGILVIAGAFLIFVYYWWRTKREFGGITGDTAGYFVTTCEAGIAILAAVGSHIF